MNPRYVTWSISFQTVVLPVLFSKLLAIIDLRYTIFRLEVSRANSMNNLIHYPHE